MSLTTLCQEADLRDVKIQEEVRRKCSFLEIDWFRLGIKEAKKPVISTIRGMKSLTLKLSDDSLKKERMSKRNGLRVSYCTLEILAEINVPTQPPTRTDEQIIPRSQWLIIGKINLLFNAQKIQKNPIFQISVDILIKIDEQWFDLSDDLLRKALAITPVIPAQPFELPPSEKGEGKVDDADIECAISLAWIQPFSPKDQAPVWKSNDQGSGDKDQGEVDSSTVTSGASIHVSVPEKAHEALAGTDLEPMQEDQTGSNSGKLHVSLAGPNPEHMDDEFLATHCPKVHENLKLITGERVIEENPESHSGSMSSMKNLDDTYNFGDQFLYDKPTEDDQEKSKVIEESDSTITDPSHQTVTPTPLVIAPFTNVSSTKPSSLVIPPLINTEATTITTSLPEITPFIALQLRVARLEQEMSEVKKTDHSADILKRHTADLIKKYSVLPGPESIKNQESEKSPKEIIKIKKEQGEEKQDSTYSIRSTDKVDLEEFDLKSALFRHMNKNKFANRNPANYHLYHALMEALIADEDAMDKKGESSKRRRHDSGASGSAQPPTKDDEQSSKKPRDSDASASKQHPALTSTGWQFTDRLTQKGKTKECYLEDTDNAHIPKVSTTTWFKPIPEGKRPATPEPEWTIPLNDFPEPKNNWANTYATTYKVPAENKLQRKSNRVGDLQLGIESYQTKINLERPNWDATDYYFKEDYTIVPKPRAVVYRDRNDQENFHLFEYNKGMETRKWSEDDKRRSKDFITAIEKRLQIRRIFRSLESFVGGRIRDIDYMLINRTT
ncbi:hypothetical protein Tco_0079292 [Tanacetum coccineum]